MKLKPNVLKILEIVLHVLGFPLLLAIALILNINVMKNAAQYGVSAFVFIIIIALFAGIYYAAYFILIKQEKKRRDAERKKQASASNLNIKVAKKADPARRTGIVLAIVVVCCLTGLWVFFDVAMPEPLATATSRTLFIEDLSDGWSQRADVNNELLVNYITRAYYSGKLTNKTLDQYLKEGVKNKDVVALMDKDFSSIDSNGYASFVGPSVDFAQNNRMTINAIVHLLLDEREPAQKKDSKGNPTGERGDSKIPVTTFVVERSNPTQESQTSNPNKIAIGSSYMYLRSNQKYVLYNDSLNKAGLDSDGLIVYEEHEGYKKIQYLAGNVEDDSYTYIIEYNNGTLEYTEQKFLNDTLEESVFIEQTSQGIKITHYIAGNDVTTETISGSATKNGNAYAFVTNVEDDNVLFANAIMGASKNDIFDGLIKPNFWVVSTDKTVCLTKGKVEQYATWDIFDMLGTDTTFDLPIADLVDMRIDAINTTVGELLSTYKYAIDDILNTVSALMSDENVVGSDIYVSLNTETGVLAITPCNVERGTLDYMQQAWLQNNGLIYIIVSLFSLRKLFIAFAGFFALTSFLIGVLRELRFNQDDSSEKEESPEEAPTAEEVASTDL